MNWSYQKSIFLTKLCILLSIIGYLAVIFACPEISRQLTLYSVYAFGTSKWWFMATIYACAVPIGILLWNLWKLIKDIGLDEIFTAVNIRRLRLISWMCFCVSLFCLISMTYYIVWGVFSAGLAFMGLLIRVIKNTFERAKVLKEEVDFTI